MARSQSALRTRQRLVLSLCTATFLLHTAHAIKLFESNSLNPCMKGSKFAASFFHVTFTPANSTLNFEVNGYSQVQANVILDAEVWGYGYSIAHPVINPCQEKALAGLCPMNAAPLEIKGNYILDKDDVKRIPDPVYFVPDLDLKVRVWINETDTGKPLACVEANLGDGKTTHQTGVAWSVALVVLLGLVLSAINSGLGHSNTAAHLASNALSLFSYFQAQALIGMTSVATPPIVRAWTQNFQWSMGIIRVGFLQELATWYQRATGGRPSTYLHTVATTSVQVLKRSLSERSNNIEKDTEILTVRGIDRVGFVAKVEITNIFFTSYIFFVLLVLFTTMGVLLFKVVCDQLIRMRKMRPESFHEFRSGWSAVLKAILFRIVLITLPQMFVMCFWELTKRDSGAEVAIAITWALVAITITGFGTFTIWKKARRSIQLHQNPAYILYSDAKCLNKWGYLYVQYKATMYFFMFPMLAYTLIKCLLIALGQHSGLTQAIGILVLEFGLLISISIFKPFMDKLTNGVNISISVLNFINAFFLVFFTEIFRVPPLAIGIMGVLFFLFNAAFALSIIILVIWTSISALTSKNPESRYQPMRDDRSSFAKSKNNLNTELDALGATARTRRMPLDELDDDKYETPHQPMGMMPRPSSRASAREKGGFGASIERPSPTGTPPGRDASGMLVPPRLHSPLAGGGPRSPTRPESPLPRADSPAYWRRGIGY